MSDIIKGMFIRINCPYALNDTGEDQEFVLTLYKPKWLDEFYFPNPLASFIDILFKEMWKKLLSAKDYNEIFNIILDGIENILVPLYDKCQYEYAVNLLGKAQADKILSYRKVLMGVSDNLEEIVECRFLANNRLEIEHESNSSLCFQLQCDGNGPLTGPDGIYAAPIRLRGESWNGENFKKEFHLFPEDKQIDFQFFKFESTYKLNDPNSYESRFLHDCERYLKERGNA